jgi:small subunit ribosomal protein S8
MSMTDPISDFLSRIRNGLQAHKAEIACPRSKLKLSIAEILKKEGYISSVTSVDNDHQGVINVGLRYGNDYVPAITGIKRISRPGQRTYVGSKDLPKVRNGLGVAIISTSKGVMTDKSAREAGIGGEVLCEVW